MKDNKIHWLDKQHPNYDRWEKAREISIDRGKFVCGIVSKYKECSNLTILDLGSGEGGTSSVFAENNFVISFDISKLRLQRQENFTNVKNRVCGNSCNLPFKKKSFDIVIMQDVIEHLPSINQFANDITSLLKVDGIIYLSTPNRNSILNLFTDPHWGFPLIAQMKREQIRKYFLRFFRKPEINRNDIAELLSLKKINSLFCKDLKVKLLTTYAVTELFKGNKGIIWSRFHLHSISFLKKLNLEKSILKISNNKTGILNNYFTPTFYFIMSRRMKN